jgi:hypothetical protein
MRRMGIEPACRSPQSYISEPTTLPAEGIRCWRGISIPNLSPHIPHTSRLTTCIILHYLLLFRVCASPCFRCIPCLSSSALSSSKRSSYLCLLYLSISWFTDIHSCSLQLAGIEIPVTTKACKEKKVTAAGAHARHKSSHNHSRLSQPR